MDCSLPGPTCPWISQARILEWVPISSMRDSSWPGIKSASPALAGRLLPAEPPGKPNVVFHAWIQWGFPEAQQERIYLPMQEARVSSLSREDALEKKWQLTLVFSLGKSHGGLQSWLNCIAESDTTEWLNSNKGMASCSAPILHLGIQSHFGGAIYITGTHKFLRQLESMILLVRREQSCPFWRWLSQCILWFSLCINCDYTWCYSCVLEAT